LLFLSSSLHSCASSCSSPILKYLRSN
jgi:hypothetical protein